MTDLIHRHPVEPSEEALHELFEWFEGIDTDHPDYVELFDEWAAEYVGDLAIEIAEGQR